MSISALKRNRLNPLFPAVLLPISIACASLATAVSPTPPATQFSAGFTSSPAVAPSLTPRPLNLSNPTVVVLADGLPEPDDLVLAPDGSIYLSDLGDGSVRRYTPEGGLQAVVSGLSEPEGIVVLPDGSLVIAEQGRNRLVHYDFGTGTLSLFLDLPNTTGQPGVDGIVLDGLTHTILVPDSPNGTLLRVGLDGLNLSELARGLVRPTGAWAEEDGSILVVDEYGNSLLRLHPDGRLEKLADLPLPDDVIEDPAGNIFVNTLGDNAIHVILSGTHQDIILTRDLIDPQGVIFDAQGNLIVTDPGHHRLVKIIIH